MTDQTVIDQSRAFVRQVFTQDVNDLLVSYASKELAAKRTLTELADAMYANGARCAQFREAKGEQPLDKALRLEMVRELKDHLWGGLPEDEKCALLLDKKQIKTATEAQKALRKSGSTKLSVYCKRVIDALERIEFPQGMQDDLGGDGDGDGEEVTPVSEKTARQKAIDALNNAARYMRQDDTIAEELISYIYQLIGELGGTVEVSDEE